MSNAVQENAGRLWAMANELRGTMDASEYKNYILGFMFYRYLSEHQEKYLAENNVIDIAEGQTVNDAYQKQVVADGWQDYLEDITASLGYAIEPDDTWATLIDKVNHSQVIPSDYQKLFDDFNKNAQQNPEAAKDFYGVFNDLNLGDSRLGSSTNERAKSLNSVVKLIDGIDYKGKDGKDILGEIYEYLIGQFAANAGKKGGEFYTPHQVSRILAKIVTSNTALSDDFFKVYDPTMGSGSLLLTVGQEIADKYPIKYYGQELNTTTFNLARMNLMMHDVTFNNMQLSNADTLEADWPDGLDDKGIDRPRNFDAVVANPPYSAKWDNNASKLKDARFKKYGKLAPASKADYAFLLHGLYHLNDAGTMAIVLPHGVLFRGGTEGKIRQALIEKHQIDTIIGLPANLFYGTGIPTIIIVLKRNRPNSDVLFIDASKEFEKSKNQNTLTEENVAKIVNTFSERKDVEKYAHLASLEEIKQNDYNLNIPRYVDIFEEEEPVDLEKVSEQLMQDNKDIEELEAKINDQLKILGVK